MATNGTSLPPRPTPVADRFPAATRQADGNVGGIPTHVSSVAFSDHIVVTISQDGRLAHWVQVPLGSGDPALPTPTELSMGPMDMAPRADDSLLPPIRFTPRTLLGGGRGDAREAVTHMYSAHVAGQLALRDPHDRRTVLVGVGLRGGGVQSSTDGETGGDEARMAHFDMLELLQKVL